MPSAPQAKFEFVATGDAAVNAQIQGVVNKLVRMEAKANEAGKAASDGMLTAKEDIRAVGEALETRIPKPLQNIISQFQSLQGILKGAGIAGAITLAAETAVHLYEKGKEIYDEWLNVNTAIKEYNKQLADAVTKSAQHVNSIEEAGSNLKFLTGEMQKYADARKELAKHNQQTDITQDPADYFLSQSYEKDALAAQLKAKLELFDAQKNKIEEESKVTEQLLSGQRQLNDARLEGMPRILAGEKADIAAADAKLGKLQTLIALENQRRLEFNASSHEGGDVSLIPGDTGQLEHSLAVYYAHADAAGKIAAAARAAGPAVQALEDTLANITREANATLEDDPYQKELDELDDYWQKRIEDTVRNSEKEIKAARDAGIATVGLERQLSDTLLALYDVHLKKREDLVKKQRQDLFTGGLTPGAIPSILFVTTTDKNQLNEADQLIKRITASLQDEKAQEELLKDRAAATGETQIALGQELYAQRLKTATQVQGLVDDLRNLGQAVHAGIGDPNIKAEADKFGAKLDSLRVKTVSWEIELKKTIKDDLQGAFVGIVSGTQTVSQAFEHMAQDIVAQLAKVVYQLYIVKLLQSALGGLFGGGGGKTDPLGVSATFGTFGGGRAGGGPVLPGMSYNVGENGPERLVMGTRGGYVVPNSSGAGQPAAAGKGVQVNIHNYGQPMEMDQSSRFDGEQYVVDVVMKNIHNNGPIRQALR